MRDIKFRVWDKDKMNYLGGSKVMLLYHDGCGAIIGERWISKEKPNEKYTYACFNDEDTYEDKKHPENSYGIIMQYTDLKDKNGKEIYEGDIIKFYDSCGNNIISSEVFFNNCSFNVYDEFGVETNIFSASTFKYKTFYVEVIGNKFENPELLPKDL